MKKISEYLIYDGNRGVLGGIQRRYRFPNGYGASVIKGSGTYGYEQGLWELAVLQFVGDDPNDHRLTYDTPITNDVIGHLNEKEIEEILQKIYELPEPLDHILGLRKET